MASVFCNSLKCVQVILMVENSYQLCLRHFDVRQVNNQLPQ